MKRLTEAFAYIFSDNEWFNKVLIGGFYFLMTPFGIGIVMLNGFFAQFMTGLAGGVRAMPYWRNYETIFKAGIRNSSATLGMLLAVYCIIFFTDLPVTVPTAILLIAGIISLNAFIITRSFNFIAAALSLLLLLLVISVGWMWIVVGWPLLIFLAMLVQIFLLQPANK